MEGLQLNSYLFLLMLNRELVGLLIVDKRWLLCVVLQILSLRDNGLELELTWQVSLVQHLLLLINEFLEMNSFGLELLNLDEVLVNFLVETQESSVIKRVLSFGGLWLRVFEVILHFFLLALKGDLGTCQ